MNDIVIKSRTIYNFFLLFLHFNIFTLDINIYAINFNIIFSMKKISKKNRYYYSRLSILF